MAEYQMHKPNLPDRNHRYPRMKLRGQLDLDDMAQLISEGNTFTEGDIVGIVKALGLRMAKEMAQGYSIKIEGIGTFTPRLGLKEDAEPESDGGAKRNARSICVTDINFRADKELVWETGRRCNLVRSAAKSRRSSTKYTPEQRLKMAQEFLEQEPVMTVSMYCSLTGLLSAAAAKELRQWCAQPGSGIRACGRGSHKVYIKEENA